MKIENGTVILTRQEYDALVRASQKLTALEGAGVDNWEGYDDAMRDFYAEDEDDG